MRRGEAQPLRPLPCGLGHFKAIDIEEAFFFIEIAVTDTSEAEAIFVAPLAELGPDLPTLFIGIKGNPVVPYEGAMDFPDPFDAVKVSNHPDCRFSRFQHGFSPWDIS